MIDVTQGLDELTEILPLDRIIASGDELDRYSHDDAEWADFVRPLAVVFPRDADDVSSIVRWAGRFGARVVPRGAGTGLSGGANAVADCVVVSMERMNDLIDIDVDERIATVGAGVLNDQLRAAAAEVGLWYPPDPASSAISTIGGNAATNAGGICCVKYGVTRDYVIGLEVVLADGEIVQLGRKTAKGATGYDLTGLMVGSEGTLGVITRVVVKLLPLSGREERAITAYFPSLEAAGDAVAAVARMGIIPAALELIDRPCIRAVSEWRGAAISGDPAAMLLARIDEPGMRGDELSAILMQTFADAGGTEVEKSTDVDHANTLFEMRRLAYPALERLGPVLTEDVCVPRSAVPSMLASIRDSAARHNVVIANIAHAGDGNLHPLIIAPEGDEAAKARAKLAFDEIIASCLAHGGTVTGEHGVGLLKLDGMREELAPRVRALQRSIKHALDPQGLLNPGKAI